MLHVGNDEWLIVDSCIEPSSQRPAALRYLEAIAVDAATKVTRVIATHWHDDHVGGLALVVEACRGAEFFCSSALTRDEFLALVKALEPRALMESSGVSEFADVVRALTARKSRKQRFAQVKFAGQDRVVWRRNRGPHPGVVAALSPSDAAFMLAQQALADELPAAKSQKRRVASPSPNHASVALWLHVGDVKAVLGADLEETPREDTGWTDILDHALSPDPPASSFKLPHHGSDTAEQPRVWRELLDDEPHCVLAPFIQGNVSLPSAEDRDRIRNYTSNAWTTSARPRRRRRRSPAVEKTLREQGRRVVETDPPMGHIRMRRGLTGAGGWTIDLFGAAAEL